MMAARQFIGWKLLKKSGPSRGDMMSCFYAMPRPRKPEEWPGFDQSHRLFGTCRTLPRSGYREQPRALALGYA